MLIPVSMVDSLNPASAASEGRGVVPPRDVHRRIEDRMTTRTSSRTVTFKHPFTLSGADELQPAGRYVVETDEELLQTLSLSAYRWLSTFIRLPGRPGTTELARIIDIDPAELEAVLARDAQAQEPPLPPADRAGAGAHGSTGSAKAVVTEGWKRWLALNATELKWTALITGGMALTGLLTWSSSAGP
jgi:hypothetical protein